MGSVLELLRQQRSGLTRQEAAVADVILESPEAVLQLSVAALAERAGVSQPTVIRFCRSVGCEGFTDLKLKLAQSLAPGLAYVSADVEASDPSEQYTLKIFEAAIRALSAARQALQPQRVDVAVRALSRAGRVLVVGLGGSAAIAQDAAHKLSRFPLPCQAVSDPLLARMLMVGMGERDVLLAISNTGRTMAVLELVELACERGVFVVSLTAPDSPLAQAATVALEVQPAEDAEVFTPMASRLVQLTMIDVLSTGLALTQGQAALEHLAQVKETLRPTRIQKAK